MLLEGQKIRDRDESRSAHRQPAVRGAGPPWEEWSQEVSLQHGPLGDARLKPRGDERRAGRGLEGLAGKPVREIEDARRPNTMSAS